MEFLHPSKGDEYHVILLLIVAKNQKTRLVRIEWDCRCSLEGNLDRKAGQILPHPERLPLLLIPLTYGTAFALVCQHHIVVYENILTGIANSQSCELDHYEPPEEPEGSMKLPIWTQWARPMRPVERFDPKMDNIYLCREDGVVRYIDIREDSNPMVSSNYKAGLLNTNVGAAFATLDLGDEGHDLLVAAGEMADGGMWYPKPREPLDLVATIRNWSPLKKVINTKILGTANDPATPVMDGEATTTTQEGRIFACSGRGPRHGAIMEIRVGTEAVKLGPTIDLGELAEKGVSSMWALPDRSNTGIYLLASHPTGTDLILLPASNDLDPQVRSDIAGLDLGEETIVAGSSAEGFIIQVTRSSINAIAQEGGILPFTSSFSNVAITAACLLTIPMRTTVLLTVVRKDHDFYLHHGHFGLQEGQIAFAELGEPILLQSEASSASVHWFDDRLLALVGTLASTLQCYTAAPGSSFVLSCEHAFDGPSPGAVCNSLAILKTEKSMKQEAKNLLVCGLRSGVIEMLVLNTDSPSESSCIGRTNRIVLT